MSERLPWARDAAEVDWEAAYAELLPRVYNYFRYRFGNDTVAEDLTSRTFEKAWTQRARYRRDLAGVSTWLFSIARNAAVDHFRAQRPHLPLAAAEHVAAAGTPQDDVAKKFRCRTVSSKGSASATVITLYRCSSVSISSQYAT